MLSRSLSSLSWFTMSKALLKSIWRRTVLSGRLDLFSLKPLATWLLNSFNAVTVEWFFLKPYWKTGTSRFSVSVGKRSLSKIFIAGQRIETGLYESEMLAGLPGLSNGIITEFFQISGIVLVLTEMLKILVRKAMPFGPRCLRCRLVILSGPAALEALHCLIALSVS